MEYRTDRADPWGNPGLYGWGMHAKSRGEGVRDDAPPPQFTVKDLAELVDLLKIRLAWFGFRNVKIGPMVKVRDGIIQIDLLDGYEVFCRLELDRRKGSVRFPKARALHPLIANLQSNLHGGQAR
jgi:hypothetical protein